MQGNYKGITLFDNTRFKDAIMESQKRLTPKGNIVICIGLFEYSGDNEVCKVIPTQSIYNMKVSKVYPLLIYKVVKKGCTMAEVDEITESLTGYDMKAADLDVKYAEFFNHAPSNNPRAELISEKICSI